MRIPSAFLTTAALFAASALGTPLVAASKSAVARAENAPWKLSNIVIYENAVTNATNSTTPSSVDFDIEDTNPGLAFRTHCSRTIANGETLYDASYRWCGPSSLGLAWYLDQDKSIYIQRGWTDSAIGSPHHDYVTCFGNWGLNPHPREIRTPRFSGPLQGTNFTQGCLEVYCTTMTA